LFLLGRPLLEQFFGERFFESLFDIGMALLRTHLGISMPPGDGHITYAGLE